jgi:ABC-2 type transport system permease protein
MLKTQWIGLWTMMRKESLRIFRIWTQTLLPSVISTSLYFLIFGSFIGDRVGLIGEVTYLQFIIPGLVMMSVLTNAYSNVVSSVFSAKFQRNIEELLVSPLTNTIILLGYIIGGVIRGIMVGILVFFVSRFFTPLPITHLWIVMTTIVGTAVLFSLLGFINAVFARKFDDIAIVPTFVLTPLTYLGGVFYSVSHLPSFWQKISFFNPILYLVNSFRYGFLGISDITVTTSLLCMGGLIIALWGISLFLLQRGIGFRQ